ncbi:MAG: ribonuclease III, partial [Propionibacteriales bacterium]|nr:ribonuclease III [Propionibacteriales bacterium]
GRGEQTTGGRNKASILSDTVEAVLGAIHLSGGFEDSADVVHRLFDPLLAESASRGAGLDWKTSLQELTAGELLGVPRYVVEESGPDHAKSFVATACVGLEELGRGEGRSKKAAEQQAAEVAWLALNARSRAATAAAADAPVNDLA